MSQILLPETTDMGGLFSITDENPQYPRGFKFQKVDDSGRIAELEYLYNAIGAAAKAGQFYPKFHGAAATSPAAGAFTTSDAQVAEIAIAQAAIPSTYWGWFLTKGKTAVTSVKMLWDGAGGSTADDCTDGESFTIANGIAACGDAAYAYVVGTELRAIAGVCAETLAATATSVHVELTGGWVINAT